MPILNIVVSATPVSTTEIDVSWTDSLGTADHYRVMRNGVQIALVLSSVFAFNDLGLTPGTTYTYTVNGVIGGADSYFGNSVDATTFSNATYNAPTGLTLLLNTASAVEFVWTDSTLITPPGPPPSQYIIYRDGVQIGTSATTVYTDTTVAMNTAYAYTVAAGDGLGNAISAQSVALNVTTPVVNVNLSVAFAGTNDFAPVQTANLKGIIPRIYKPTENTVVRSRI